MSQAPKIEIRSIREAVQDPVNANSHLERGARIVENSLRQRGFFRPIAAAGKGVSQPVIKAGNLTQESTLAAGMEEAIFIYTDGTRPIVHVRTDIAPDSPEAALLALEDNRASQVGLKWNPEILSIFNDQMGADMEHLFSTSELRAILDQGGFKATDEINFDDFKEPAQPQVLYRVVIDDLNFDQAQLLAADLDGAKVEKYRP